MLLKITQSYFFLLLFEPAAGPSIWLSVRLRLQRDFIRRRHSVLFYLPISQIVFFQERLKLQKLFSCSPNAEVNLNDWRFFRRF